MKLKAGSSILFVGDSITDAGRGSSGEATPWEPFLGLGNGYVAQVCGWLHAIHPELKLRVINRGVSGNTVRDLALRWQADVLANPPGVLCVMIGINDVWRRFDSPHRPELAVGPEEYLRTLDQLVEVAQPNVEALVLATPFFIEPHRADPMRRAMDEYGEIVCSVAAKHGAAFVDLQSAFDRLLVHLHPTAIAADRVHPGPIGHAVIAQAFLEAFGLTIAG